jgi:hypothetical protein
MLQPPPRRDPKPLRFSAERVRLTVPQFVALVGMALVIGLPLAASYLAGQESVAVRPAPAPLEEEPVPQVWATDTAPSFGMLARTLPGKLPPADPRQRRPPCDPDMEEAIDGVCWVPLALAHCPVEKGKAFEHNGKCYGRALQPARVPSTGEPRQSAGIAAP